MVAAASPPGHRLDTARRAIAEYEAALDGVLVTDGDNRRYISGFMGSAGQLLITADAALLLTDFRYVEQAGAQAPGFKVVKTEGHAWPFVAEQAARLGIRRLGFEAEHLTFDMHARLVEALHEKSPATELTPLRGFVETTRQIKDPAEIAQIRRAVLVADRAFERVAAQLEPGVTEREVAWRLEVAMREAGAEGLSFPIIVASGPNGAMPHHRAGEREIQAGETITIDMGCRLDGYCSDLTRTVVLGQPDARFWEIHAIVLRAQQTCEDGLKAGVMGTDGDLLARNVIQQAGFGEYFGHGTGHGVGLAVHENPYLSPSRGDMVIQNGTVVTVEPGIYLPGWGGIRIEDMVVVGQDRCHVLTTAHKNPVIPLEG